MAGHGSRSPDRHGRGFDEKNDRGGTGVRGGVWDRAVLEWRYLLANCSRIALTWNLVFWLLALFASRRGVPRRSDDRLDNGRVS